MDGLRYRLSIEVRADSLEYAGRVEISARDLPRSLVLDSVGHRIRTVTADDHPLVFERKPDEAHLTVPAIPEGTRALTIEYDGTVDDGGLRGFYVSPLGEGRLYTTYFEPTGARRLLPCLDHPAEKAVFEVEVTAPDDATVISNTPVVGSDQLPEHRRRVRFSPTPPMSTYLLFLGIGPFEELASEGTSPRVIVATARGRSGSARFSLEQGARAVAYFAEYYAEPYPLSKLHLIAVPQFGTGAMENWGAITFQEYLLLHDDRSTVSARMRSIEVICHEIAHQWFGNLVTMRWWNDLWLNESFASFVAVQAVEALAPEWNAWDDFLALRYAGSMLWDALPNTHPIRVEVSDPLQIREIFDEISYGKGSSVLRMAEAYVGTSAFRQGVSQYLAEHRWGNAESQDLWRAVAAASSEPVERIFSEWVARPGFPVVRARLEGDELRLHQRRFALLEASPAPPWPIPLQVRAGGTIHRYLFDRDELSIPNAGDLPIVNPGRTGYYRVQYEGVLRERILARFAELPPVDRWGVLNDSRAEFLAGTLDLVGYLDGVRLLETETDPFVLTEAVDLFRSLYPLVHAIPRWEAALRSVVVTQSERLGERRSENEPDRIRALRESITLARVILDRAYARQLAAQYPDRGALEPERVRSVLTAYALEAGPSEYAELRSSLGKAPTPEARRQIASALGAVPRVEWVRAGLEGVLSGELLLGPWLDLLSSALIANPDRSLGVWGFLTERVEPLLRMTAGTGAQSPVLQMVVPLVGLPRPAEMRSWAASTPIPEASRAIRKGLDLLELYLRTIDRSRAA